VKASLFYLARLGSRAEIEAELAGARPGLYQRMLRNLGVNGRLYRGADEEFRAVSNQTQAAGARFRISRFTGQPDAQIRRGCIASAGKST
jgi:hypothetical protein